MSTTERKGEPRPSVAPEPAEGQRTLRRRGILAALWALGAGFVAKQTTQPVAASTGMLIANSETGGVSNNAVGRSVVIGAGGFSSTDGVLIGDSGFGSARAGLLGTTLGIYAPTEFSAIYGNSNSANAVFGDCGGSGTGVKGSSISGNAVRGVIPSDSSSNAIAVYGLNSSSYAGPGPGAGGFGVYGLSAKGHGLVGATATAGGAAIVGATNGVAGAYAAAFYGPVVVSGALYVLGGPKSAAVAHPDGQHRLLYCFEAPESWFEDLGEGRLTNGQADITLDPEFTRLVETDRYHVFLTEHDDHHGLYVTERTPLGFTVRAKEACEAGGTFSWRVVAKRADIQAERFATVTFPHEPVLPNAPAPVDPEQDRQERFARGFRKSR
jgi:hypothetical protein